MPTSAPSRWKATRDSVSFRTVQGVDVMHALFTRSRKPLSRLICSVLGEPVSHVALLYSEFVIHSNASGLHIETCSTFEKTNEIVYKVRVKGTPSHLFDLLAKYERSAYDVGALLWLGVSFGLRRIGIALPKVNLWQTTGMFLCTEWATKFLCGEEDSLITPYGLYRRLS